MHVEDAFVREPKMCITHMSLMIFYSKYILKINNSGHKE